MSDERIAELEEQLRAMSETAQRHQRRWVEWKRRAETLQQQIANVRTLADEAYSRTTVIFTADDIYAALDGPAATPREPTIEQAASNALWNAANRVGHAIDTGHLDGTDGAAVAAAIRATTPEEFDAACAPPQEPHPTPEAEDICPCSTPGWTHLDECHDSARQQDEEAQG